MNEKRISRLESAFASSATTVGKAARQLEQLGLSARDAAASSDALAERLNAITPLDIGIASAAAMSGESTPTELIALTAALGAPTSEDRPHRILIVGTPGCLRPGGKSNWMFDRFLKEAREKGHTIEGLLEAQKIMSPKMPEMMFIDEFAPWPSKLKGWWYPRQVYRRRGKKFVVRR